MTFPSEPRGRDPREPVFFLSYPRPPQVRRTTPRTQDVRQFPARFFEDVSEHVAQLMGTGPGEDPGSMDIQTQPGTEWNDKLRRAVGTCQVFVPLLSPGWQTSPWCQLEWQAFSRRAISARATGEPEYEARAVIPVLWVPFPDETPDAAGLRQIQWFIPYDARDAESVDAYQRHGVHGLMFRRQDQPYQDVVWFLALAISQTWKSFHVAHQIPPADWHESTKGGE